MPNWCQGSYAIKGKKENVLNFLNEGLKNSKLKPKSTCRDAVNELLENGKTKCNNGLNFEVKKNEIVYERNLTLDTFRPMPDTFLQWDTTNHKEEFKNVSAYQKRKYGCVGWYDYGCNVLRGTKWNAELSNFELTYEDDEIATIEFYCNTAWTYPYLWLEWVKKTFNVNILLCVHEESNEFNFYGEYDDIVEDYDDFSAQIDLKEEDFESEDDYYDALNEREVELIETMNERFEQYVIGFDVNIS